MSVSHRGTENTEEKLKHPILNPKLIVIDKLISLRSQVNFGLWN